MKIVRQDNLKKQKLITFNFKKVLIKGVENKITYSYYLLAFIVALFRMLFAIGILIPL